MALPDANAAKRTLSLNTPGAAAWWSLALKSAAALGLRLQTGSDCSQSAVPPTSPQLCGPLRSARVVRWSSLLAVVAQRALAASLLELPLARASAMSLHGDEPELHEVLARARAAPCARQPTQAACTGPLSAGARRREKKRKESPEFRRGLWSHARHSSAAMQTLQQS